LIQAWRGVPAKVLEFDAHSRRIFQQGSMFGNRFISQMQECFTPAGTPAGDWSA